MTGSYISFAGGHIHPIGKICQIYDIWDLKLLPYISIFIYNQYNNIYRTYGAPKPSLFIN